MSAIKDAIAAMKEVMMLANKVERAGSTLSEISHELRDHDRRLVRLETVIEFAKGSGNQRKPPTNE
ncbi:MAG: hypothetical protein KZQ88_17165 [Candidatus Thiodiazotropha sp. (ex Dulcina madagascariensis)]|nr:hypothetical protein [Candidatus Thiodiazotropha sp. (ex Dulcina madagascariensis)]MCU7929046.1 hypothetical protein [Candidatus Thiodiazotropha sp. (ex Dulcina madagascariensis)]